MPAGFMIDTANGRMAIVLCHGAMQANTEVVDADGGSQSAIDSSHSNSPAHNEKHRNSSLCAFALATGAEMFAALPAVQQPDSLSVDSVADRVALTQTAFGPVRAQRSRAPPNFS